MDRILIDERLDTDAIVKALMDRLDELEAKIDALTRKKGVVAPAS